MKYEDWRNFQLGEVCTVTDCLHKTAPTLDYQTQYRMLRTANIRNGKIDASKTKSVSRDTYELWSARGYLEKGDVILTREAPMGEVGIIRDEPYKFFLGQRMLQLKANKDVITPEFLYYSLQGRDLQHQIMMNEGTGSVVSNIRIPLLKKMEIKVPPLHLQEQITRSLSAIDGKIWVNESIKVKLEKLAHALFKHWFIDFEFPDTEGSPYKSNSGKMVESELGEIPEGWRIVKLGEFINLNKGLSYKSKFLDKENKENNSFPMISLSNFNFISGFRRDKTKLYFGDYKERHLIKAGDIAVAATDVTQERKILGSPAIVPPLAKRMIYSLDVFKVSSHELPNSFIYYSMQTPLYRDRVENYATGTTVIRISADVILDTPIIVPENLDKLWELSAPFDAILEQMHTLEDSDQALEELRNTLLPRLLSGEIELPQASEVTVHEPV